MSEGYPAIVIDNGSYECKAGIAGDNEVPQCCFRAVVGRPKDDFVQGKEIYIGDETLAFTNLIWDYLRLGQYGTNLESFIFTSKSDMEIVRDMKEKLCYVALDFEEEMKKYKESDANNKLYKLPDGNDVVIKNQRFRCPEILFRPFLISLDVPGIHQLIFNSIMKCKIYYRTDFYSNILLSGGNTMFPGFQERLSKELTSLTPQGTKIKVIAPTQRKYLVWNGGQIISQLSTFQYKWITRSKYEESGPQIVQKKYQ